MKLDEVADEIPCSCSEDCDGCWSPFYPDGGLRDLESEGWARVGSIGGNRLQTVVIRDYTPDLAWVEAIHDHVYED